VVQSFYDAAVSGADPVDTRPGFGDLLAYCEAHGIAVVLVENASRFARDLAVQLTGHALLQAKRIELVPVDAPAYFTDPSPTAELVRQILERPFLLLPRSIWWWRRLLASSSLLASHTL
jgi:DNA invertase Pin-like site-specific DNA recombinase